MLVSYTNQVYSIALVVLGTTYKMFLYEIAKNSLKTAGSRRRMNLGGTMSRWLAGEDIGLPTEVRHQNTAHLFSGSMAIVWLCLDVFILAHKGLETNIYRFNCVWYWKVAIAVFVLMRIGLIAFFATLSQYETDPLVLASIGCAGVIIQFTLRAVGSALFPCNNVQTKSTTPRSLIGSRHEVEH